MKNWSNFLPQWCVFPTSFAEIFESSLEDLLLKREKINCVKLWIPAIRVGINPVMTYHQKKYSCFDHHRVFRSINRTQKTWRMFKRMIIRETSWTQQPWTLDVPLSCNTIEGQSSFETYKDKWVSPIQWVSPRSGWSTVDNQSTLPFNKPLVQCLMVQRPMSNHELIL